MHSKEFYFGWRRGCKHFGFRYVEEEMFGNCSCLGSFGKRAGSISKRTGDLNTLTIEPI